MNSGSFSRNKGQSGSKSFNQSGTQSKTPKGFWARFVQFLRSAQLKSMFLYRKSRTLLWVGTTGFILLIAPFAFSHFLEISEELQQISMQGAQGMLGQQKGF